MCWLPKAQQSRLMIITALYNSGIGLKASVDSGNYDNSGDLVGYLQFNEGTGSMLTDNTSNSNKGTLNNMDSSHWVTIR